MFYVFRLIDFINRIFSREDHLPFSTTILKVNMRPMFEIKAVCVMKSCNRFMLYKQFDEKRSCVEGITFV